jgi:hypothetical protein
MCRRLDIACDRPVLACGGVFQLNKYAVNIATCTAQTSDPSNLGHEIGKRLAMRLARIADTETYNAAISKCWCLLTGCLMVVRR